MYISLSSAWSFFFTAAGPFSLISFTRVSNCFVWVSDSWSFSFALMSALIRAGGVILVGSAAFFSFWIFFFTAGVVDGAGAAGAAASSCAVAAAFGGGFAAFMGLGLFTRAGLLSAGGAAFFDSVLGKSKTSSAAFISFFFGLLPVGSSLAKRFCWVSVSIIFGAALALGIVGALGGGADFAALLLFTISSSAPTIERALPRFCWLSIVVACIGGGGGFGGGFGGGPDVRGSTLLDLEGLEAILNCSGVFTAPAVLATIRVPDGGGGGFGYAVSPVVTGSAGGGADEVAFPCMT